MIHLLPFSPQYAQVVMNFYNDPAYSHFSRGVKRLMKLEDCSRFDDTMGSDALMVYDDVKNCIVGMIELKVEDRICRWSLVIDKADQREKIGHQARLALELYCKKKIGARMMYTEALAIDEHLGNYLARHGYRHAGTIEKYSFVDGNYEDTLIYYKEV